MRATLLGFLTISIVCLSLVSANYCTSEYKAALDEMKFWIDHYNQSEEQDAQEVIEIWRHIKAECIPEFDVNPENSETLSTADVVRMIEQDIEDFKNATNDQEKEAIFSKAFQVFITFSSKPAPHAQIPEHELP